MAEQNHRKEDGRKRRGAGTRLSEQLRALREVERESDSDFNTLCDYILNELLRLTQSDYAFFGFLDDDESLLTVYSWSAQARADCKVVAKPIHYPIPESGIWSEGICQRKAVIVNDYSAGHPGQKGLPHGHVPIIRLMSVPVFRRNRIHTVAAVANKATEYSGEDAENVRAFMTGAQVIMDRRRAEETLRVSEEKYRNLVESLPVGISMTTFDGQPIECNRALQEIYGYELKAELMQVPTPARYYHPEDREQFLEILKEKGQVKDFQVQLKCKDGSPFWACLTSIPLTTEAGDLFITVVQDITERKLAEERLRLLSHRLVEIQEGERRAIARELHDQTGQALTMLRILLDRAKVVAGKVAYPILDEARAVLLETVEQVREMSLNLRPSMLDDLGLTPTLLWYFDRYTTRTKIRVNFKHTGLSKTLPLEVRIATYRIVQEALSNVARHARTDEVTVNISLIRQRLHLQIEDSGTGFDPVVIMPTSAGISGMEERVHLLGGRIQVDSTPGMGTRLTAEIPLPK